MSAHYGRKRKKALKKKETENSEGIFLRENGTASQTLLSESAVTFRVSSGWVVMGKFVGGSQMLGCGDDEEKKRRQEAGEQSTLNREWRRNVPVFYLRLTLVIPSGHV